MRLAFLAVAVGLALSLTLTAAQADETWAMRSGQSSVHFNTNLLSDLGIEISVTSKEALPATDPFMEEPNWSFRIEPGTDLAFLVEGGAPVPRGLVDGVIRQDGVMRFTDSRSGRSLSVAMDLIFLPETVYAPATGIDDVPLYLRSTDGTVAVDVINTMVRFMREESRAHLHYMNLRLTPAFAEALGRPELEGLIVGMGDVAARIEHVSGTSDEPPYVPNFGGGFLDVKLGILGSIQQVGHEGSYPNGLAGLSMATTSCNVGDVDVPWLAPMDEDHPSIHMALYREKDGRFEQIGTSWMKHGFYALSHSQCTPCQNHSGGTFLGVGCSDTYGVGNNSDRRYLGPRVEWDPFGGTWECTASHFAGGQNDCQRRHSSSGHLATEHRLVVEDQDLGDSNATYYYEGYYIVRGDQDRENNWASLICTMNWNGTWDFNTPSGNNPHTYGPAVRRWNADQHTDIQVPDDGKAILSVKTTDLGGGTYHYEYTLLNLDSDREFDSFELPMVGVPSITNIGFHDSTVDPADDWQVTLANGVLKWETAGNNPLVFGYMYNFRFDADAAPTNTDATMSLFQPGSPTEVSATTLGPTQATAAILAGTSPGANRVQLTSRPNPISSRATFAFELPGAAGVDLGVYDVGGRLIAKLASTTLGEGAHQIDWDGADLEGQAAASGVYYARFEVDGNLQVRPLVVVR